MTVERRQRGRAYSRWVRIDWAPLTGFGRSAVLLALFWSVPAMAHGQSSAPELSMPDFQDVSSQPTAAPSSKASSADTREGDNETQKSEATPLMTKSRGSAQSSERSSPLLRYLIGGGLIVGGIVLAMPPLYYLPLSGHCNERNERGCVDGYRKTKWYDYAELALGGVLIGAGVAVLVWPTSNASGEPSAVLVVSGKF